MHELIVGVFDSYRDAEAAVQDLELAGIVGEQVEVISNADRDARTDGLSRSDPSNQTETEGRKPGLIERIERAFAKRSNAEDVRDDSGDQPEYIGRQEFYATHVHEGRTVVIVRGPSTLAERAQGILASHGGKAPSGGAPRMTQEDDRPRRPRSA